MRQLAFGSIVLVLMIFSWGTRGLGQLVPVPRGELRIVDKNPANSAWITANILEHLMEADKDGQLVPGLAVRWQWRDDRTLDVTLHQGVTFHNVEVFDAAIVQLNWEENMRLRQPHMPGTYLSFQAGS